MADKPITPALDIDSISAWPSHDHEWVIGGVFPRVTPPSNRLNDSIHSLLIKPNETWDRTKPLLSFIIFISSSNSSSFFEEDKQSPQCEDHAGRKRPTRKLSARSELLDKEHGQLASSAKDHLTGNARDLDEIRGQWIAMVRQRETLMEHLLAEDNAAIQLELDREKDSVAHLSRARADIEGTIHSPFYILLAGEPHNCLSEEQHR
ncbi:hypothetical protein EDB87DRAFT_1818813, partial [Lactarius vividus]